MINLFELRKKEKLTQEQFAKKHGITRATYANYESGKTQPDFNFIIEIANYYKVSCDYILNRRTANTLFLNELSEDKKQLIKKIVSLDAIDCRKIEGVIEGYLYKYYETKQKIKNNFSNIED